MLLSTRVARTAAAARPPATCTCAPTRLARFCQPLRPSPSPPPTSANAAPRLARTLSSHAWRQNAQPHSGNAARAQLRTRHASTTSHPSSAARAGPTAAYDSQVAKGHIQNDPHQRSIVSVLQTMYDELDRYTPPPIGPLPPPVQPSMWDRLMRSRLFRDMADELHQANTATIPLPPPPSGLPKGLYLFGSVGCGKSFLMDLFYAHLPDKYRRSANDGGFGARRVHFHQFMMDVHKKGHLIKLRDGAAQDWIVMAAREIAGETRVLCFDEFQVTDIADAMILRRLMEALHAHGVVCVMTSNRAPDELYKNGIQREQFMPCIELIKRSFFVQCLDSEIDYRKRPRELSRVYFSPIDPSTRTEFAKLFAASCENLTPSEPVVADRSLSVWGRPVRVPHSTSQVAHFTFADLCGDGHSAADYLEITKTFGRIFVSDVPQLGLETKDQARRFILFVDAAYEARTKLFVLSDPPIAQVFSDERPAAGTGGTGEISAHQRAMMDDLGLSADIVGASSIFTGDEEVFAFARAVSRITEMGSVQWARAQGVAEGAQGLKEEQVEAEGVLA
ncbi:AFG1-like ATPase-domain-containing protein [Rhodotorula diobovata]|uniref:AFG1-like ATPase-domain-containing protein n=1 Tax=Rhodotorula diobovata TaxID=5288 RepID=A0A5C5G718_9BASI|nr:AFG1-like ATPase-domain-containing protein [Rhodotorula diobovata]